MGEGKHLFIIGVIAKKSKTLPYIKLSWRGKIPKGYDIGFRVYNTNEKRTYDLTIDSVLMSLYKAEGRFIGNYTKHAYNYAAFEEIRDSILDQLESSGVINRDDYLDRILSTPIYKVMYSLPETEEMIAINMRGEIAIFRKDVDAYSSGIQLDGWYSYRGYFRKGIEPLEDKELLSYFREHSEVSSDAANIINVGLGFEVDASGRLLKMNVTGTEVYIPKGVVEIGNGIRGVIDKYTDIGAIYIPKSVKRLNKYALRYCRASKIVFEEGSKLRGIDDFALNGSYADIVNLPKGIEYLGRNTIIINTKGGNKPNIHLSELEHLAEIKLDLSGERYNSEKINSGCYVKPRCFYSVTFKELAIGAYVILENRSIDSCSIDNLIILGDFVSNGSPFMTCGINKLTIHANNSDVHIPEMAFSGTCIESIEIIGDHKVFFGKLCFYNAKLHTDIEDESIPMVGGFGNNCFSGASIESITLTDGMDIGTGVFFGATITNLKCNREIIPSYTFYQASIDNIDMGGVNNRCSEHIVLIGDCAFKEAVIQNSHIYKLNCGTIGKEAFSNFPFFDIDGNSTGISITGVRDIRSKAFYSSGVGAVGIEGGNVCVGERAFGRCKHIEVITFNVTELRLGVKAIYDIPFMRLIDVDTITEIADGNFEMCPSLENINVRGDDAYSYSGRLGNYIDEKNLKHTYITRGMINI